jgi:salicylate hydroxylase
MTAYDNVFDENGIPPTFDGPWVTEVPASQIAQRFAGWEPDLTNLLSIPNVASRWAVHIVAPLPTFAMNRVCLIGDAAHAMTPHQGLGGGQGIEDAYILARLFAYSGMTVSALPHVLSIYDFIRRPASQMVARQSLVNGLTYGFFSTAVGDSSLTEIGRDVVTSCCWLLEDRGAEKECLKAEAALSTALEATRYHELVENATICRHDR